MPVLDAKALETDPEGIAFLRAVLRPTRQRADAVAPHEKSCDSRPPWDAPLALKGEVPLKAIPHEAAAPIP